MERIREDDDGQRLERSADAEPVMPLFIGDLGLDRAAQWEATRQAVEREAREAGVLGADEDPDEADAAEPDGDPEPVADA